MSGEQPVRGWAPGSRVSAFCREGTALPPLNVVACGGFCTATWHHLWLTELGEAGRGMGTTRGGEEAESSPVHRAILRIRTQAQHPSAQAATSRLPQC